MAYTRQNLTSDLQHGAHCYQQGNLPAAESSLKRVLSAAPKHPDALHLLGLVYMGAGDQGAALKLVKRAVKAQPRDARFHRSLGLIQAARGRDKEALQALRKALALSKGDSGLHNDLGCFLSQQNRNTEAIAEYKKAIRIDPGNIMALVNLSHDLLKAEQLTEARQYYERAVSLDPAHISALNGLAYTLLQLRELEAAADTYETVLKLDPMHLEACNNLAGIGKKQGNLEGAIRWYSRAIDIDPNCADAYWNRALAKLVLGQFDSGWADYEWRWKRSKFPSPPRNFEQPLWDGSSLEGKTLLLHAEQGRGDSIQFIRYIGMIVSSGGKVVVECQPSLISLFSNLQSVDKLIAAGEPLPEFDVQAPLLSLPHVLGTTLETIPSTVPYLFSAKSEYQLPTEEPGKLKVGIVWAGSPGHVNDHNRSATFSHFDSFLSNPAIQIYSLQVGERAADLNESDGKSQVIDITGDIKSYADTAAVIDQLDLVISVDTSVAHLAGAMAKPVWVLLPFAPDWRWLLDRSDSPWYPTMRLFRQQSAGDWEGVFADVADALAELSVS